ncbi:MAG: amidase [Gammaproteobacteria bacterium]|nr:amidase [Gammaproteobacteria bacterium]MBL6999580.1 amidase [Gammaproteobacteria bacterium]
MNNANFLTALEVREALQQGLLSSTQLVEACFERIDEIEQEIGAWTHLDKALALEQARQADEFRRRGLALGPLHGIPVGIKDIIDTFDYPTERGSVIYQGRTPSEDATLVALLREAGAIILGKTVTTELAVMAPGKTRNPHNTAHTPGGSSSGSAAAVAAGMVPLSVGTQTNGSVIRPASYCGVYGFKPSFGRISRYRVLTQSEPLDTIGVFARSLEDLALIADVLMRYDSRDSAMQPMAAPAIASIMAQEPPLDPHFAFVRTPMWDQLEASSKDGLRELIDNVNQENRKIIDVIDLAALFKDIYQDHQNIMEADLARNFAREYRDGKSQLSSVLCEMIERGQGVLATDYNAALLRMREYNQSLEEIFDEYDAIITPSTFGPAPSGLEKTGSPLMNTIWTFCGNPALSIPLLQSPEGLPVGVQMVAGKNDDARLFRTARWLLEYLND